MRLLIQYFLHIIGYQLSKSPMALKYTRIYRKYSLFTMIPKNIYCDNLFLAEKNCCNRNNLIVECGTWKGGMIAGITQVLDSEYEYHLFDSFTGLPEAKEIDGIHAKQWQSNKSSKAYYNNCTADINTVDELLKSTKKNYYIHKGWFADTLPNFKSNKEIELLRLDGDWYDSTLECLKYLYPKVKNGGIVILDDYYTWEGCSKAVHDYFSEIKSKSTIQKSMFGVAYIIKKD